MNTFNNRMRIYIRATHLTDDVQARILEMGCSFTQREGMGEGDHALTVWELAHFDPKSWEDVAKWMGERGVDFNTEVLPPLQKQKR